MLYLFCQFIYINKNFFIIVWSFFFFSSLIFVHRFGLQFTGGQLEDNREPHDKKKVMQEPRAQTKTKKGF